jgi:hypothetical protein
MTVPAANHIAGSLVKHVLGVLESDVAIPYPAVAGILARAGVAEAGSRGLPVPFRFARGVFERAGVETRMPRLEARRRIAAVADSLTAWAIGYFAERSRRYGAVPAVLAVDLVTGEPASRPAALTAAEADGLIVFDLLDVYSGVKAEELRIAEYDDHPNSRGNCLIAARLLAELTRRAPELGLPVFPAIKDSVPLNAGV